MRLVGILRRSLSCIQRDKIQIVQFLDITADQIAASLLNQPPEAGLCLLDSCGVGGSGGNRLIAAIRPVETLEFSGTCDDVLRLLEEKFQSGYSAFFTLSYDFGARLQNLKNSRKNPKSSEPDLFISLFDTIAIHDYNSKTTLLTGNPSRFAEYESIFRSQPLKPPDYSLPTPSVSSNFTKDEYFAAIESIKERIRRGDTYQVNLTQQLTARFPSGFRPEINFSRLRALHPAPFAAFLRRNRSSVVSASPEQFIRIETNGGDRIITASPIKGTRPRGITPSGDKKLSKELISSEKDRAENVMIVDLLRNDLGRICSFGDVRVTSLCNLEQHPSLFHLVSTITGKLEGNPGIAPVIKALFPCGSITGAPKISTIRIIDEIEPVPRGLSMGAIGFMIPPEGFQPFSDFLEMSVAIRTMVVRDQEAIFNVGGGIVIDSDPEKEYEESLLKAKALFSALSIREFGYAAPNRISREQLFPTRV